jgi:hypothetical protein
VTLAARSEFMYRAALAMSCGSSHRPTGASVGDLGRGGAPVAASSNLRPGPGR